MDPTSWSDLGRRDLLRASVVAGIAAGIWRPTAPALADQALDVQILQTAASIENAAVGAYETILALPVVSGSTATPTLKAALNTARDHHLDHARAFNDAAGKLGGGAQSASNPALAQVVSRERGRVGDLASVIDLVLQIETVAAHTYQNNVASLGDANARRLSASVLGVEAQHIAMLAIARHLAVARTPDLITDVGPVAPRQPGDVGRLGFPDAFAKMDQARPAAEGAVR
jgi:hypothetical protein